MNLLTEFIIKTESYQFKERTKKLNPINDIKY